MSAFLRTSHILGFLMRAAGEDSTHIGALILALSESTLNLPRAAASSSTSGPRCGGNAEVKLAKTKRVKQDLIILNTNGARNSSPMERALTRSSLFGVRQLHPLDQKRSRSRSMDEPEGLSTSYIMLKSLFTNHLPPS